MLIPLSTSDHQRLSILTPPSESTRHKLVELVTNNPSKESIFFDKFGILSKEEAHENAKRIEETCFASADEHFKEPGGDRSSVVELYSKEVGHMIFEVLKKVPRTTAKHESPDFLPPDTVFDIPRRKRAFIDEAVKAKELLSPLTKRGNSYKRVCFSSNSFGIGDANAAGPIRPKKLDLRDNLFGADAGIALRDETIGKLPDAIMYYDSDLNLENKDDHKDLKAEDEDADDHDGWLELKRQNLKVEQTTTTVAQIRF
ncbi:RAN GTPase-activating protein 2-like [Phragmites australis]|uniref:RAN GTPase-activating protein 2-like n=1 Tax=Phragmites australis TaxID=29695 RepID=UPI002D76F190|nr:RAN GTPase-activating protein 2-like [Phragmites australis]